MGDGERQGETPLPWTQGLRRDDGETRHAMEWQEVLWRRLTGRLRDLEPGETTAKAERKLGWDAHAYYYVGFTEPDFGSYLAVMRDHDDDSAALTRVTPFDTGGMAHKHIRVHGDGSLPARAVIVARETYEVGGYQPALVEWMEQAFATADLYVEGEPPASPFVPEIVIDADAEPRSWRWEGRVRALDLAGPPLTPAAVFFDQDDMIHYTDWIEGDRRMSYDEAQEHLRLIRAIGREVEEPHESAAEFIKAGLQ